MLSNSSLHHRVAGHEPVKGTLRAREFAPAVDEASREYLRGLAGEELKAGVVLVTRGPSGGLSLALGRLDQGHRGVAARLGLPARNDPGSGIRSEGATFFIDGDTVVVEGISTSYGGISSATIGEGQAAHRKLSEFLTALWRGR